MSVFSGTFLDARGKGEHPTGLAGRGTIRLEPSRLIFSGQRPQTLLATIVAGTLAFLLLVGSVTLFVMAGSTRGKVTFMDLKLLVVVLAAVVVGIFLGTKNLLLKVLPLQSVELAVEHPFVVFARVDGGRVEILTTAQDLSGLSVLETMDGSRFVEELSIARNGVNAGYRSAPGGRS